jgi:hypothetical protein
MGRSEVTQMEIMQKPNFIAMAEKWPSAYIGRQQVEIFTGGVMTAKTVSELDYRGLGCKSRVRIGRKIAYPVPEFIAWLESRAEFVEES